MSEKELLKSAYLINNLSIDFVAKYSDMWPLFGNWSLGRESLDTGERNMTISYNINALPEDCDIPDLLIMFAEELRHFYMNKEENE